MIRFIKKYFKEIEKQIWCLRKKCEKNVCGKFRIYKRFLRIIRIKFEKIEKNAENR